MEKCTWAVSGISVITSISAASFCTRRNWLTIRSVLNKTKKNEQMFQQTVLSSLSLVFVSLATACVETNCFVMWNTSTHSRPESFWWTRLRSDKNVFAQDKLQWLYCSNFRTYPLTWSLFCWPQNEPKCQIIVAKGFFVIFFINVGEDAIMIGMWSL